MRALPLPKLLNIYLGFLKLETKTWVNDIICLGQF